MLVYLLLFLYSLAFLFLCWINFRLALYLFILSLPSYLIRFNISDFPSTLLELNFGILFLVWLIKYARYDVASIRYQVFDNRILATCYLLLATSSIISIFISDQWYISIGQWRAYFLEPMLFFIILLGRSEQFPPRDMAKALVFSTISISVLAFIQSRTGLLYPPSLWDDIVAGRATAFFTSPNAVGLYLGPCFFLGLALVLEYRKNSPKLSAWFSLITAGILLGLLSAQSVGALIAVVIGCVVFAAWYGKKHIVKTVATGCLVILIGILIMPQSRNLITTKIHSGNNRLVLWQYSKEFLTKNPTNFIFGAGIRQFFRKIHKPHYNVKEMERLIYPHNWFLNFWSEIGLFGMLAISSICGWLFYRLVQKIRTEKSFLAVGAFCALLTVIMHGLIDVPYFKNDLAMLFWIMSALTVNLTLTNKKSLASS